MTLLNYQEAEKVLKGARERERGDSLLIAYAVA
jgi:hypothetical protein